MSGPVARASFYEGQVLGAGDLQAVVDGARLADAIHERSEHTWGVSEGLALVSSPGASGAPPSFVVQPGVAVDPNGRRIVVASEQPVSFDVLQASGVISAADAADAWYPVFIVGMDRAQASAPTLGPRSCAGGSSAPPTRVEEDVQVEYGRPGDELTPPERTAATSDPPDGGVGDTGERGVLVGFVQLDNARTKIQAVGAASANGAVRYAGVHATEVVGHAGATALRTRPAGKRYGLELAEQPKGGALLRFVAMQDDKVLNVPFQVSDTGDLTIAGAFKSPVGNVPRAESGTITSGMRVPLPDGVTEDMVTGGGVAVHVIVAPRFLNPGPSGGDLFVVPQTCQVDDDRRVYCEQLTVTPGSASVVHDMAACDYLIVVVPTGKGTP
jgi:hypothetical protein